MSELLSPAVWETIVAALGLALIYVVLWSGLSLLGHEDIRRKQIKFHLPKSEDAKSAAISRAAFQTAMMPQDD
jgi:hypothetical protein